jgi:uncharacterized protein
MSTLSKEYKPRKEKSYNEIGMRILFSPSESKDIVSPLPPICKDSFVFDRFYNDRLEIVNAYNDFVMMANDKELAKLFGVNDKVTIERLRNDIFSKGTNYAMLRYDGVAYQYLRYRALEDDPKSYIDKNCLIFSNLFGPISPVCFIPEYKLKQGESVGGLKIEAFYRERFSPCVDEFVGDDDVLDLRAGFYEKFYTLKAPYITVKFLKDGKVVSHYAKAYRGLLLAQMAKQDIKTKEEFGALKMEGIHIEEIKTGKLRTEYIFNIER